MEHQDEENVYNANFGILKTLSQVMTLLTQNWVKNLPQIWSRKILIRAALTNQKMELEFQDFKKILS